MWNILKKCYMILALGVCMFVILNLPFSNPTLTETQLLIKFLHEYLAVWFIMFGLGFVCRDM